MSGLFQENFSRKIIARYTGSGKQKILSIWLTKFQKKLLKNLSNAKKRFQKICPVMREANGVQEILALVLLRRDLHLIVTEQITISENFLGTEPSRSRSSEFSNPKYMKTQCCLVLKITLTDRLRKS